MNCRSSLTALLVLTAGVSHASFELALIPDVVSGVVYRWDIENDIYLGAFGSNRFTFGAGAIAINQSISTAYVGDGAQIRKFNYDTGEYLGSFAVLNSTRQINVMNDGRILVTSNATGQATRIYSSSGTFLGTIALGGAGNNAVSTVQTAGGQIVQLEDSSSGTTFHLYGRPNEGAAPVSNFSGTPGNEADLAVGGNQVTLANRANPNFWFRANITAAGFINGTFGTNGTIGFNAGYTPTGLAYGHTDAYQVATNGTRTQLGWFDSGSGTAVGILLPSQVVSGRDIAIVIAPEPGSMAALGIGLAALIRKRRGGS